MTDKMIEIMLLIMYGSVSVWFLYELFIALADTVKSLIMDIKMMIKEKREQGKNKIVMNKN